METSSVTKKSKKFVENLWDLIFAQFLQEDSRKKKEGTNIITLKNM